ncbi:MAG: tRNA (cytidine(34)-2'-O)-methyltransferase [Gammaproteobacteria bacterium]
MFHVVLYQPEIPPNTGNIIRLCANTGARLHLIEPLGFSLEDRRLRRAGLDYHELTGIAVHAEIGAFMVQVQPLRVFGFSTIGQACYTGIAFRPEDAFLFGPETRGLPPHLLERLGPENIFRIPMRAGCRSLNLSNAVAVIVYEAWRQQGFCGAGSLPTHAAFSA